MRATHGNEAPPSPEQQGYAPGACPHPTPWSWLNLTLTFEVPNQEADDEGDEQKSNDHDGNDHTSLWATLLHLLGVHGREELHPFLHVVHVLGGAGRAGQWRGHSQSLLCRCPTPGQSATQGWSRTTELWPQSITKSTRRLGASSSAATSGRPSPEGFCSQTRSASTCLFLTHQKEVGASFWA